MRNILDRTASAILLTQRASHAQIAESTARIATGRRVRTALDDPNGYFTASRLEGRAAALENLMDGISQGRSAIEAADASANAIKRLLGQLDRLVTEAESAAPTLDATSRTLLDATGLTLATDVRSLGLDGSQAHYTFAQAGTGTASLHDYARDGWTVGDLMNTINASADGVTASLSGGRLTLTADEAGADVTLQSGTLNLATGLEGRIWDSVSDLATIPAAEAFIAGRAADATFTATTIDYGSQEQLSQFLGATDAATLSDPAFGATTMDQTVFVLEGYIDVATAGSYQFGVRSDDGFKLEIDGSTAIEFLNPRGPSTTSTGGAGVALTEGLHHIKLTYWERGGGQDLEFTSSLTGGFVNTSVTRRATADPVFDPAAGTGVDQDRLDAIVDEIDRLAADGAFGGINLALGDDLDVLLDERGVRLGAAFGTIDSAGLGLSGLANDPVAMRAALEGAEQRLEVHAARRRARADLLTSREVFNQRTIDTLLGGRDDLVLADQNEESAVLLAAQTKYDLGSAALASLRGNRDPIFELFG